MTLEFGVPGGLPRDVVVGLGRLVEELGYDGMWVNDTRQGNGFHDLAELAAATERVQLGVGVAPLSRWTPSDLAAAARDLPAERTTIGVGAGHGPHAVQRLADGIRALRTELPGFTIYVGGLGPLVLRAAGDLADGVLLNWCPPDVVVDRRAIVLQPGRPVTIAAYVRAATGPGALDRLQAERDRYGTGPSYARHFETFAAGSSCDGWLGPDDPGTCVEQYRDVLDRLVLRAVAAEETFESYAAVARAFAPR